MYVANAAKRSARNHGAAPTTTPAVPRNERRFILPGDQARGCDEGERGRAGRNRCRPVHGFVVGFAGGVAGACFSPVVLVLSVVSVVSVSVLVVGAT